MSQLQSFMILIRNQAYYSNFVCKISDLTKQCIQLDTSDCRLEKLRAAVSPTSTCQSLRMRICWQLALVGSVSWYHDDILCCLMISLCRRTFAVSVSTKTIPEVWHYGKKGCRKGACVFWFTCLAWKHVNTCRHTHTHTTKHRNIEVNKAKQNKTTKHTFKNFVCSFPFHPLEAT